MEKVFGNAKIIEFNGLPGSGKSTITSKLKLIAEQNKWKVEDSSCFKKFGTSPYMVFLNHKCLALLPLLIRLKGLRIYNKKEIGQIIRFLNYVRSYECFIKMQPKSAVLLQDEGIIQALVSILFVDPIDGKYNVIRKIFNRLKGYGINWYQVNLDNDAQLSYERIIKRGTNLGRMDLMNEKELKASLNIQKETFSFIRNVVSDSGIATSIMNVDTCGNAEQNASIIFNWLE